MVARPRVLGVRPSWRGHDRRVVPHRDCDVAAAPQFAWLHAVRDRPARLAAPTTKRTPTDLSDHRWPYSTDWGPFDSGGWSTVRPTSPLACPNTTPWPTGWQALGRNSNAPGHRPSARPSRSLAPGRFVAGHDDVARTYPRPSWA